MNDQFDSLTEQYDTKKQDYYHNPRTEMVQFIPKHAKRVLDIGCSTGGFGAKVKEQFKDIQIWGIEPYKTAADEASKVLDKVLYTTFEADMPELSNEKFDVIIFNDVLEHLIEPGMVLGYCHQYLNNNGVVVASIPNILYFPVFVKQILIREDWKYDKEGILDNTHLRFFTKKSIVRLFNDNGYAINSIQGINKHTSLYYSIFNALTLNKIKEWRYQQYAVVATSKKD